MALTAFELQTLALNNLAGQSLPKDLTGEDLKTIESELVRLAELMATPEYQEDEEYFDAGKIEQQQQ